MNTRMTLLPAASLVLAGLATAQAPTLDAPVQLATEAGPIDVGSEIGHAGPTLRDHDGDGKLDLLVSNFRGTIGFYKNVGTSTEPAFEERGTLQAGTENLKFHNWRCVGISPRFADLNADGHQDIVSGCYEGLPYVAWGSEGGFSAPQMLTDKDGGQMHAGRFWDPESREHTSGPGPGGRAYSALPVDFDADGDLDLIVGTDKGGLFMRENVGTNKAHAFATELVALDGDGGAAKIPGGYAMPLAIDWDGDGLWDLMSGSKTGIYWLKNVGDAQHPEFDTPQKVVESSKLKGLGERKQIDVADFDADGDLDLLVGDYRTAGSGETRVREANIWLFRNSAKVAKPVEASSGRGQ